MKLLIGLAFGLIMGAVVGAVAVVAVQSMAAPPVSKTTARANPGQTDVEITLRKDYLTRVIGQEIQKANLPFTFQNLQIEPRGNDQIALTGQIDMNSFRVPATITAQPTVVNGQLKMNILRTDVGSIPIPIDLGAMFGEALNSQLASLQSTIPYRVNSVQVSDQGLTLQTQEKK
ncbi:MAG: DUF2140 family protein [Chloroflexota bacterium]|nr:MAG: DUF2140 family protein [Chloroflexota bacterium]